MVNLVAICMLFGCILLDGSDAVSFSSKLVHRFSDEAKERWISKSGNVSVADSWPKKNSVEYLELLLSNDWKRQKTRVKLQSNNNSSRNQLLFPSEGSQTHFFGNQFYWLHYTWIDIGTPNVSFLVALDAGSNLLWVPCQCIQCAPLSASYYTSLDRNLSEYDPSSSSSSKNVSCSHPLCKSRSSCKSLKDPCPYIADYSTEDTSSSGYLVDDILHLASFSKHAPQSSVQSSVIIGCGRKQTGSYLDGAAPDGVMGLGLGDVSVPSLLAKAGLIQNSFSICFDENDSGSVFFGDQGPATQQSTSFLPIGEKYDAYFVGVESYCIGNSCLTQSGFQALVDSGASFTFLPTEIYAEVVMKFDKLVSSRRISLQGNSWKYCYNARYTYFTEIVVYLKGIYCILFNCDVYGWRLWYHWTKLHDGSPHRL
ncbi:aspartic proteinase-like protein 1 isoform X3 [Citrus sinensis]|uniref:aspartic proteinase-like protein 1 isoform X3 n=1 Tax=Citrus sinensis TaxID=2711 RepID=UPI002278D051|nr:aspartic proteinase-like protein 1 isoform X3 [Citrus sinensis]